MADTYWIWKKAKTNILTDNFLISFSSLLEDPSRLYPSIFFITSTVEIIQKFDISNWKHNSKSSRSHQWFKDSICCGKNIL